MKWENQRVVLTKRMFKDALLSLLEYTELRRINVSLLCRKAGLNRATFYNHYTSPRDVMLDIQREIFDFEKTDTGADLSTAIREYLLNVCRCMHNNSDKLKILLRYDTAEDFMALLSEFNRTLQENRSKIKAMDSLDETSIRLISTYIASGVYVLLRQWIIEDIDKSPEEITELIMDIISK